MKNLEAELRVDPDEVDAYCRARSAEHLAKTSKANKPAFGPMYRQFEDACIAIYTHHPGNVQGADDFAKFILDQKRLMSFIRSPIKAKQVAA
jgi:hypothetical protein